MDIYKANWNFKTEVKFMGYNRHAGFIREKVWFYFPGGYRTIRILSWLKNEILSN